MTKGAPTYTLAHVADTHSQKSALPKQFSSKPTDPTLPTSKDEAQSAPARQALQAALNEVDTPEKAEQVLDTLTTAAAAQTAEDVIQNTQQPANVADAAKQVQAARQTAPPSQKAAAAIEETARVLMASQSAEREALSKTAQAVFNPEQHGASDSADTIEPQGGRLQSRFLREAVLGRLKPLDALDAKLFLRINHLPHTPWLNSMFHYLTMIFTGGAAWYALMCLLGMFNQPLGRRMMDDTAASLAVSSALVEFPIKRYFRRKRPFIDIMQAIVIGKKPATWSFPSGHSAAAFAGALLLGQHFPRQRGLLYLIASLVGFSRIYLGDHYPSDVLFGSALGMLFATAEQRLLRWVRRH